MIRDATPADLPAVLDLNLASWRDVYGPLVPEGFLGAPVEAFLAERWRALPEPGWLLLDEAGGVLRGFVAVQGGGGARDGLSLPWAYIRAFHVRPGLRGGGIGRGLFEALVARLREAGEDGVWLDVADANEGARAAYRRLGGDEGPPFEDDIAGHPVAGRRVAWRW